MPLYELESSPACAMLSASKAAGAYGINAFNTTYAFTLHRISFIGLLIVMKRYSFIGTL